MWRVSQRNLQLTAVPEGSSPCPYEIANKKRSAEEAAREDEHLGQQVGCREYCCGCEVYITSSGWGCRPPGRAAGAAGGVASGLPRFSIRAERRLLCWLRCEYVLQVHCVGSQASLCLFLYLAPCRTGGGSSAESGRKASGHPLRRPATVSRQADAALLLILRCKGRRRPCPSADGCLDAPCSPIRHAPSTHACRAQGPCAGQQENIRSAIWSLQ